MPRASVVIPTRNAGPQFARTLAAIQRQASDEEHEILVVDSGSTDGTVDLCQSMGVRVICIPSEEFGHGRTRNLAISQCQGEYVALTVQDAIPADEHWLPALVQALEQNPQAAGAYSRHIPHVGSRFVSRYVAEYWYKRQRGPQVQRLTNPEEFARLPLDQKQHICTFNNVGSIVRRSVWEECPFPEISFAEDLAWGYAVLQRGYSLLYEPASRLYHSHERSAKYELARAYIEARAVGEIFAVEGRSLSCQQAKALLHLWEQYLDQSEAAAHRAVQSIMANGAPSLSFEDLYREISCRAGSEALEMEAIRLALSDGDTTTIEATAEGCARVLDQRRAERATAKGYAPGAWEDLKVALRDREIARTWQELRRLCINAAHPYAWQVRLGLRQVFLDADRARFSRLLHGLALPGAPPRLNAEERRVILQTLWQVLGSDRVRYAVFQSPREGSDETELTRLEIDGYIADLAQLAFQEGELTPGVYTDIVRHASSVVVGHRLGEAVSGGANAPLIAFLDARLDERI